MESRKGARKRAEGVHAHAESASCDERRGNSGEALRGSLEEESEGLCSQGERTARCSRR